MARNNKGGRRPDPRTSSSGARRLGAQQNRPMSASAQRRYERSHGGSTHRTGWIAVGAVVVAVVILVVVTLTTGGSKDNGSTGAASGQHPLAADPAIVKTMTTIPAATFDSVGTASQPAPFTVTKNQSKLTANGKPEFIYYGAEYCPYCALMRYSVVAALSRFGTFHNLKQTTSAADDGNIPTFSFLGATYTSPYVTFSPYEYLDRNQQPLQDVPKSVNANVTKYSAAPFNTTGQAGIPFLNIANRYVANGDPVAMGNLFAGPQNDGHGVLANGGPGVSTLVESIANPTTSVANAIGANLFIAQANYISAAICSANGGQPAAVCNSPGVQAAAKVLAAQKAVG